MSICAAIPEWSSSFWTAVVLVALAFVAFVSRRAIDIILDTALGWVRGRPTCREISAAGHREIKRLLSELMLKTRAFRVCVYQFHNGTQFFRANHMWKVSLTHESTHVGVTPTNWKDAHDLPIVAMMEFVGPMIDDDAPDRGVRMIPTTDHRVAYYDINNLPVCVFQALANSSGVRYALAVNLVDKNSKVTIGAVVLYFDDLSPACADSCQDETPRCLDQSTGLRVACARVVDFFVPDMLGAADKIQFYLTTDFQAFRKKPGFVDRLFGRT